MNAATLPAVALLAVAGTASAQVELYAVDFTGNLYRLNQATGAATLVGATGIDRLNSAAADSTGVIYANRSRNPTISTDLNELIRIDRTTGAGTVVANYAQANDLRGLAFGPGNILYGLRDNVAADDLVTIDTTTGAVTTVGPTGRSDLQGLTATGTGELYAVGVTGTGVLCRIDATTAAATVINGAMNSGGDVQSIEWSSGTQAWVARVSLRTVDLTNGTTTLVGATGLGDIRGLAAVRLGQPCYANCDASTTAPVLNVADFTCFLQKFAANDNYANCDGSTTAPVLNVADFTCFLQKFAAGCP